MLALTFDDAPGECTVDLLDLLDDHDATGTFFVIGREIAGREAVLHRIARGGHEIGNHSFSHRRIGELDAEEIERELRSTSELIVAAGGPAPRLFRPPYGLGGLTAQPIARRLGMETVLWTANPKDWDGKTSAEIFERIIEAADPGAVIVLHDGGNERRGTVQALEYALPSLKAEGFVVAALSNVLNASRGTTRRVVVRRPGALRTLARRARTLADRSTAR